jgi:hypothetical protein
VAGVLTAVEGCGFSKKYPRHLPEGGWRQAGKDLPHPKENTMTAIAELSLEQIDSLFGLDDAPDIKADPHIPLVLPTVG